MAAAAPSRRLDRATLVRRFDVGGELLKPIKRGSDGAMLFEGVAAREGIQIYRNADGTERRELVTLEAINDTVATGVAAPVTLLHPEAGFVTEDSAKDLVVGDVQQPDVVMEDAEVMGGFAKVRIAVRRKDALDAIAAGTHELSPGYDVEIDPTPGEDPRFGRYDARQVGRKVNHLAIVPKGRGDRVVLRTDSSDAVQVGRADPPPRHRRSDHEVRHMRTIPLLLAALGISQRFDTDEAAVDAAIPVAEKLRSDASKRADAEEAKSKMDEDLAAMTEERDKLKADMEELKGKYDALLAKQKADEEAAQKKADAAELASLQSLADTLHVDHDGLDLQKLRAAIACTRVDSVEGKSPEYIAAVIDMVRKDASEPGGRWDWSDPTKGKEPPAKDGKRRDGGEKITSYYDHADTALRSAEIGGGTR